ncbi:hypothetical protein O7632_02165 [Solwaraspora sp. WMMD406]|uniref:hypothetical protein n=1 Tax=Solwaraspora sp. WMMD406 TaxID=3016095 RepID=UPI0024165536|nr:hypothetical protein [Solwaraspora sp. WMMD406]MDG4762925.1 hypothetical protein [Solwaraspora sp. WMMD406]
MPLPQDGSARFAGVSGPSRRFALIVALLVLTASLPMLATIGAGSATVAENGRARGSIPFLSQPYGGPVIVLPDDPTPTAGPGSPAAGDIDGDDPSWSGDPHPVRAGGPSSPDHATPPRVGRPAPSSPTDVHPSVPSPGPTSPDTTSPIPDTTPSPDAPPPSTDPEVADPEVADPEVADPEVADPEVADPEVGTDPTVCPTPTPIPDRTSWSRPAPTPHPALVRPAV